MKQIVLTLLLTLPLFGCGRKSPNLTLEAMTVFGHPAAFTVTNEGAQDIIVVEVKLNDETVLTDVLRFGSPNQPFKATTLAQGESISLDNPVLKPANSLVVYTDQGSKTFDLRE